MGSISFGQGILGPGFPEHSLERVSGMHSEWGHMGRRTGPLVGSSKQERCGQRRTRVGASAVEALVLGFMGKSVYCLQHGINLEGMGSRDLVLLF